MEKLGLERFTMVRIQEQILSQFTPEQQIEIKKRMNILSSIIYFIGQDFKIDIELNQSGKGWHWDFKDNVVRVDPKDLLDRPIEYSCYVMGHEAGHRRVSRTDFISQEVWQMPGFSFLMNAIEDPRENNFVADNYPAFAKRLQVAFDEDWDIEQKSKEIAQERIGRCPRFMEAGYEYIRLWFHERLNHTEFEGLTHEQATEKLKGYVREDILPEVRQVVLDTLDIARQSWWLYPTKKEADSKNGEHIISQYAEGSYNINYEDIWPVFKTLVDQDVQDEKTKKLIEELQKQKQEQQKKDKSEKGESQEDKGTDDEESDEGEKGATRGVKEGKEKQGELEQGDEQKSETEVIDFGSDNSQKLTQEDIQKMLGEMSEEERQKLEDEALAHAQKIISELTEELNKQLQGKLNQNPKEAQEEKESDDEQKKETEKKTEFKKETEVSEQKESKEQKESREKREKEIVDIRKKLQEIADKDIGRYDKDRREVAPIINRLTNDLRSIFSERRKTKTKTGFKSGRSIDIGRRITEIAKGILPIDSRAWIKKERPTEKDYAFSILVDLSGSMQNGQKIEETFKAVITLSEVFNNLGMKFNVVGFNDRLHDFLRFGQKLDQDKRHAMEQMIREVEPATSIGNPMYNDDGWAVSEVSKLLSTQKETQKILLVLSDGEPVPSSSHSNLEFELKNVIENIEKLGTHEIVGLGLGMGTGHVSSYYSKSISNIPVQDLPVRLAQLLKEIVEK